ncbi:hypothetical protein C8J31_11077 [Rhizobium sp. PP-CC-2G-626]|nr:hypothetical protein C8J31_11077 [Rhizobium sp. PP-CC-2G-626]
MPRSIRNASPDTWGQRVISSALSVEPVELDYQSTSNISRQNAVQNRYSGAMSRFEDLEAATLERLRTLKAKPDMTINLIDMGTPLNAAGYSQEEVLAVLLALEQEKIVALAPGNRLLILKDLSQ